MNAMEVISTMGNLSIRDCRAYPVCIKNSAGEWVEVKATINSKDKRIEITEDVRQHN